MLTHISVKSCPSNDWLVPWVAPNTFPGWQSISEASLRLPGTEPSFCKYTSPLLLRHLSLSNARTIYIRHTSCPVMRCLRHLSDSNPIRWKIYSSLDGAVSTIRETMLAIQPHSHRYWLTSAGAQPHLMHDFSSIHHLLFYHI